MKLYIAQQGECLKDIAIKFNIAYEELCLVNRMYKNRHDLNQCPILVPYYAEEENRAMKIIKPHFVTSKIEILNKLLTEYTHYLKEMVMSAFTMPDYVNEHLLAISEIKESIKKLFKPDQMALKEFNDLEKNLLDLVKALKTHEVDTVKKAIKNIASWPEAVQKLLQKPNTRDDSLKTILKDVSSSWRDYTLNLGAKEYSLAELEFKKIKKKVPDLSKALFSEFK